MTTVPRPSAPAFAFACALALALGPAAARAAETAPPAPPTHERGGFVAAITGGLATGTASGYPNDLTKIDVPLYYAAGGVMIGESSALLVMGAFARELNFGVWASQSWAASTSGHWRSSAQAGGFRVEVFPLGWLVPALRDVGVVGQFGVGGGSLVATTGNSPGADGVQSYLGAGAFWEWMFAHPGRTRWVLGPSVEAQFVTSRPFERAFVMTGLRFAFYTGR